MPVGHAVDHRACEEYVAMAAHELRGQATVIAGAADTILQLVEGDEVSPRVLELLQMLARNGRRMRKLTIEVLSSSYLERGELATAIERIPLLPIIRWAVDDLAPPVGDVRIDCDPHLLADVDPDHFEQIMTNLLSNAFAHASTPVLVTAHGAPYARTVEIAVRDGGPGVAEEDQDRLFERFTSLATRSGDSTGLGLSISRGLARAMGGDLTYEHADPGSSFVLTVPAGD